MVLEICGCRGVPSLTMVRWQGYAALVCMAVLVAWPTMASAKRKPAKRFNSQYGPSSSSSGWQLSRGTQLVNGISVRTQTVCPSPEGGISSDNSQWCSQSYVYIFQIPSGPPDLVITFSGLTGFGFGDSGFGVLMCSGDPSEETMLCTPRNAAQVDELDLDVSASAGNLMIYVPQIPAGESLTLYIREQPPNPPGPLIGPRMTIGRMAVTPPVLSFGSQRSGTVSPAQTVSVRNWASPSPTVTVTGVAAGAHFALNSPCSSVPPGGSCVGLASFAPADGARGEVSETLHVLDGLAMGGTSLIATGRATTREIAVSPSIVAFGSQKLDTTSEPQTITLSLAASENSLEITDVTVAPNRLTDRSDFAIVSDGCSGVLAPGRSCEVQVSFAPGFPGSLSSRLVISDATGESHEVVLQGTANAVGAATLSTPSLQFERQPAGLATAPQTLTFTHPSGFQDVYAVDATPPFSIVNESCSEAGAQRSCEVAVAFHPPFAGVFNGTLTVASTAIDQTAVIVLSGRGSDLTLSADSTSQTITRGGAARVLVTATSEGGFAGQLLTSCAGVPAGLTCTASPVSRLLEPNASVPIEFAIAPARAAQGASIGGTRAGWLLVGVALVTISVLLADWLQSRQRRSTRERSPRSATYAAALLVVTTWLAISCGPSSNPDEPSDEIPTGTFSLSLQVASGPVFRSVPLTLHIE